jgi:NTP pyrophosphatase (non-canonical NTP hydrolase)
MTFSEYQDETKRTFTTTEYARQLANCAMGLAGEAGEVVDILKKVLFQGHKLDRAHLAEEIGDLMWYAANLCNVMGFELEDVCAANIEKLKERFPDGFDEGRSADR